MAATALVIASISGVGVAPATTELAVVAGVVVAVATGDESAASFDAGASLHAPDNRPPARSIASVVAFVFIRAILQCLH